ncbi:ATP-binding protein [Nostoc sp. FACHB-110]|uniref:PAS domain-containing hybrid sensor histidine kinase/response regulator n=1 Tax=Nostoc sp. FACHB-110 TaxID=2692834 RepID=UPI0016855E3B|nr:ATP-binding protein [Nostoc sp. FACHB-110]MBD2441022.1 response regulator [Nostoc sp. FACHB-110]
MKNQVAEVAKRLKGGFVAYNQGWQVTSINAQAAKIFNKNLEDLLEKNFWYACPEFAGSRLYFEYHRAIAHQSVVRFEQFFPLLDAWFEVAIYPTLTGLTAYFQNITERKQLEIYLQIDNAALSEINQPLSPHRTLSPQTQNWQTVLDNSPDVIFQFDRHLRLLYVNLAIEKATGSPPSAWIGKTHSEMGFSEHIYHRWDGALRLALTNVQEQLIEWELTTPSGERIYQSRFVPELNFHGVVEYVLVFSRDVTENKRVEKERARLIREQAARVEAERANRIKDEFLAVLSHELRSPLNPILGWARLLQTRQYDTTTLNRALEIIERNAKAQAQLIEDLLDVSRILRGKLNLKQCPVNLAKIVEAAIETVQLAAQAKEVDIQINCQSDVSKVLGDPDRLQQVIWNLLSNAVKFTPSGGQIAIELKQVDSQVQIIVKDNGEGITPEFLPFVFDYFRQADSSITRSTKGLGLGLAIVRHLVELHGGRVTAASQGKQQGATFTLSLPMMSATVQPQPPDRSLSQAVNLEGLRILIVDDDADSREFVAFLLEQQGAIATTADCASQALQMFAHIKPDLLISDIGMPQVDGYSLLNQIKELNGNREILAIAFTAHASESDRQKAYRAGFQRHITKPIEAEKFLATITNLVEKIR